MRRILLAAMLAFATASVSAGAASAAECAGVNVTEEVVVDGTTLQLNGLGLRLATLLRVKVYVAALYVATPSKDPQAILAASAPKRLVLHFVRGVGADDLNDAWEEGFGHTAKGRLASLEPRIAKLTSWMVEMEEGNQLIFTHVPGKGVEVQMNGKIAGTIEGEDFANALFAIWLGDHPPNPGLRSGLLGGACE